jgi:3-mercaptopyruvate sulfurtransferase SseA
VFLHGAGIAVFLRKDAGPGSGVTTAPAHPREVKQTTPDSPVPERITIAELRQLQEGGEPVLLADVRTDRTYQGDTLRAQGAIRLPPDDAVRRARELGLDHHGTVVLYCA